MDEPAKKGEEVEDAVQQYMTLPLILRVQDSYGGEGASSPSRGLLLESDTLTLFDLPPPEPQEPPLDEGVTLAGSPAPSLHRDTAKEQRLSLGDYQGLGPCVEDSPGVSSAVPVRGEKAPSPPQQECCLCEKQFSSSSSLNKHLVTHSQHRPHCCQICSKRFKRQDHLSVHLQTHRRSKPFFCSKPGCTRSYCDMRSLLRHSSIQHGEPWGGAGGLDLSGGPAQPWTTGTRNTDWPAPQPPSLNHPCSKFTSQSVSAVGQGDEKPALTSPPNQYESVTAPSPAVSSWSFSSSSGITGINFPNPNPSPPSLPTPQLPLPLPPSVPTPQLPLPLPPVFATLLSSSSVQPPGQEPQPLFPSHSPAPSFPWPPSLTASPLALLNTGEQGSTDRELGQELASFLPELLRLEKDFLPLCPGQGPPSRPVGPSGLAGYLQLAHEQNQAASLLQQLLCNSNQQEQFPEPQLGGATTALPPFPIPDPLTNLESQLAPPCPASSSPPAPPPFSATTAPGHTRAPSLKAEVRRRRERKSKTQPYSVPPSLSLSFPHKASSAPPRRQRLRPLDPASLVSPSQVAMASFSIDRHPAADSSSSNSTSYHCIQEEQIFTFPSDGEPAASGERGGVSAEWGADEEKGSEAPCVKTMGVPPGAALSNQGYDGEGDRAGQWCPSMHSPLVIPVSVPVDLGRQDRAGPSQCEQSLSIAQQLACRVHRPKGTKKSKKKLEFVRTLFTPPLVGTPPVVAWGGGGLYPSQLRSPVYLASHLLNPGGQPPVSYTPPPMLSPLRPGTGLYFSTLQQAPPSVPATGTYTAKLDVVNGISLMMDDTVVTIEPCINIGPRFQAVIPPLREEALAWSEEHRASLVWEPWGDLAENRDTQSRVEKLLSVGCSSALPGGGANTELALHCLHEAEGDVLAALKTLLFTGPQRPPKHPLRDYHYAGSDHWTPEERNLFQKALSEHGKDFHCIQRELQCKTVAQCVEYYYTMKKHKKFLQPGRDSEEQDSGQEPVGLSVCKREGLSQPPKRRGGSRKPHRKGALQAQDDQAAHGGAVGFACKECGRVFLKIKSRNAHMKSHRQHDRGETTLWGGGGASFQEGLKNEEGEDLKDEGEELKEEEREGLKEEEREGLKEEEREELKEEEGEELKEEEGMELKEEEGEELKEEGEELKEEEEGMELKYKELKDEEGEGLKDKWQELKDKEREGLCSSSELMWTPLIL